MACSAIATLAAAGPAQARLEYQGLQLHSLWNGVSSSDMDRELKLSSDAGSNVVRVDVGWSTLELKGKGQISSSYTDKLDRFVEGASSRGMKVIITLWSTPCWASSAPDELKQGCEGAWWDRGVVQYAPTNMADYGDIVRWITARYGDKLAALEVWNEPTLDGTRFWIAPDRAAAYAALVKAAYAGAEAGDPDVDVLATLDGTDREFLGAIYDHDVVGSYDGLAVHPYGDSDFSGVRAVQAMQRDHGDETPVWITEFGWSTTSGSGGVSEAVQATNITAAFQRLAGMEGVRAAVLYELRDEGTDPSEREDNWGVVERDYTPKSAYSALTAALTGTALPPTTTVPTTTIPTTTVPTTTVPTTTVPTTTVPTDGTTTVPTTTVPTDGTTTVPTTTVPIDGTTPVPTTTVPTDGTTTDGDDPPSTDTADTTDGDGSTPSGDSDQDHEVTLKIVRRGKELYGEGKGPPDGKVKIEARDCKKGGEPSWEADVSSNGTYRQRLGKRRALEGCRFTASSGGEEAEVLGETEVGEPEATADTDTGQQAGAGDDGDLPFTGYPVLPPLVLGVTLVTLGLTARRLLDVR